MTDDFGATATETVTITITGTNDVPVITTAAGHDAGAVTEAGVQNGGNLPFVDTPTASGTLTSSDVDHNATATWSGNTTGTYGSFAINATTGLWTYTLNDTTGSAADQLKQGEVVTDVFTATVTDDHGATATELVTITITGTNDSPVITTAAGQDAGSVTEAGVQNGGNVAFADTPTASGTLTSSDVDHNATATWSGNASGTYGSFAIDASTGVWTYTLNDTTGGAADQLKQGEVVTDTFTATVTDDHGATATETVTITITGTNDIPVITTAAGQDAGSVTEAGVQNGGNVAFADTPTASGTLTSSDVDHNATAAWSGNTTGTYGSFAIDASTGVWSYTLNDTTGGNADKLKAGEVVTDIFTATVTDDHGATATETVTITITGTNDIPVITTAAGQDAGSVTEAGVQNGGNVAFADTPTASGTLTSSDVDHNATAAWSGNTTGTYGSFAIDASTGVWSYTLNDTTGGNADKLKAGEVVTDIFTATVTDDHGATATETVTITITGTNDIPVITTAAGQDAGSVTEAGVQNGGNVAFADTPTASGTLTSSDVDHNATAAWSGNTTGTYGSFAIDASTGVWSYTLNDTTGGNADKLKAGEVVTDIFTATVTDDHGATATETVTITITGTNDIPVITTAAGQDAGSVTEAGVQNGGNVAFADTPTASGTLTSSDVDHNATAAWSGNTTGTYGSFAIDASTGVWSYTLNDTTGGNADKLKAGEVVTDIFTATVTDDHGATATETVTITITGTNDIPVITTAAGQDAGSVTEAGVQNGGNVAFADTPTASGTLTSSDVDHNATAAWSGNTTGTYGSFAIDASTGVWSYTLNDTTGGNADKLKAGEVVTDIFTATVTDDHGATATETVTITITGTNDIPVITTAAGQDAGSVTEAGVQNGGNVAFADTPTASGTLTSSDVDHNATAAWSGNTTGTYGSFAIDASTGVWSYTLNDTTGGNADKLKAGEVVTDIFTATVTDDHGATATETVTITITGTNDIPVITTAAGQDAGSVTEAGVQNGGNVAFADTPTASGTLTSSDVDHNATAAWSGNTTGTYGSFAIDASTGVWSYTLNDTTGGNADKLKAGEVVTDIFTATVTDDHGATATETVTITITGTNDTPPSPPSPPPPPPPPLRPRYVRGDGRRARRRRTQPQPLPYSIKGRSVGGWGGGFYSLGGWEQGDAVHQPNDRRL